MKSSWTCANGHDVSFDNQYCGICGARRVIPSEGLPPAGPPPHAPGSASSPAPRRSRKKLIVITGVILGVLVAAGVVGVVLVAGGHGGSDSRTVTVELGDLGACDEYTQERMVGARLTLTNASGDIFATDTTTGSGEEIADFCVWRIKLAGIERSDAYELTVELPAGPSDSVPPTPQTLTYSYAELEDKNWTITLTGNR